MVDDKPDDSGPQAGLDRPKRAPPTLDLDAIKIPDETRHADAADAAGKPARERSWPLGTIMSSAIVFSHAAKSLVPGKGYADAPSTLPPAWVTNCVVSRCNAWPKA